MAGNYWYWDTQVKMAIKMNCFYAKKYHLKFPFMETDELESIGLVVITEALRRWRKKKKEDRNNFLGYIKIALQREYHKELKRVKIQKEIISQISIAQR